MIITATGIGAQFHDAIAQGDVIVMLKRYPDSDLYGTHVLSAEVVNGWMRGRGAPYSHTTIGLLGSQRLADFRYRALEVLAYEEYQGWTQDEVLRHFIGEQIIPLEWKREYAAGNEAFLGQITVLK